jgi:hypothetical protein
MKLLELQKKLEPIKKDSQNPHFKNYYFDINTVLEVILPELHKLGMALEQPIKYEDGGNVLHTIIRDSEGVVCESSIRLPDLQDPQKLGGAITYYRRYSLVSLLALEADDDDGNTASGAVQKQANQDYESQGLVRFNPPYTKDKEAFNNLVSFLKEKKSRFDPDNKCWWVTPAVETVLKKKFNQD